MLLTNANSKQTFNEIFFKSEGYHMLLTNANFKQTLNEIFFDQIYANTTVSDHQWQTSFNKIGVVYTADGLRALMFFS